MWGIDSFLTTDPVQYGNIAWLVNASAVTSDYVWGPTAALMKGFRVRMLFGPEHGIHGVDQAGVYVDDMIDAETGLPVISLYGAQRSPKMQQFNDINTVIIDLLDIGTRYSTYLSTIAATLEALKTRETRIIVLDRPNHLGRTVEGPVLDPKYKSFVGIGPMPIRHGLTTGEIAQWIQRNRNLDIDLHVIRQTEFSTDIDIHESIFLPPSPNLNGPASQVLYAGTCLFEGTNISEGRGTTFPFQIFGAPWLRVNQLIMKLQQRNFMTGCDLQKIYFKPIFSKYAGEVCEGIFLHVNDFKTIRPVRLITGILGQIFADNSEATLVYKESRGSNIERRMDLLWGASDLGDALEARADAEFQQGEGMAWSEPIYLYP